MTLKMWTAVGIEASNAVENRGSNVLSILFPIISGFSGSQNDDENIIKIMIYFRNSYI